MRIAELSVIGTESVNKTKNKKNKSKQLKRECGMEKCGVLHRKAPEEGYKKEETTEELSKQ